MPVKGRSVPAQLTDYHGTRLVKQDADVLVALESTVGIITPVKEIQFNISGGYKAFITRGKRVVSLRLLSLGLKEFPEVITQLTELQNLYLDDQRLQVIPPSIGLLNNLKCLHLVMDPITAFPEEICHLPFLEELNVAGIPWDLHCMILFEIPTLKRLHLGSETLTNLPKEVLPEDFGNLAVLKKLDLKSYLKILETSRY